MAEKAADEKRDYLKKAQDALLSNNLKAVAEYEAKAQEADALVAKWDENGAYRIALHAATQGLLGSLVSGKGGALESAAGVVGGNVGQQLAAELGKAEAEKLGLQGDARKSFVDAYQNTGAVIGGMLAGAAAGNAASSNADIGALLAAAQGGSAAETVDEFNRRLHWLTENPLIKDLAEKKAKEVCRGDNRCEKLETLRYGDALERVAKGMVDDEQDKKNTEYVLALQRASQNPTSEGAMGSFAGYIERLKVARQILAKYEGQPMLYNGKPMIGEDGKQLTYFSATKAERANKYAEGVMSGEPDPLFPQRDARDKERLEYFGTNNGSAKKDYLLEETLLGGKVTEKAFSALGKLWMGLDGALGYEGTATLKGTVSRVASTPEAAEAAKEGVNRVAPIVDKYGNVLSTENTLPSNVGKSSLTSGSAKDASALADELAAAEVNIVDPEFETVV